MIGREHYAHGATFRRTLQTAGALLFGVVLILATLVALQSQRRSDTVAWSQQSLMVKQAVTEVAAIVAEMESEERGYLLTGQESYSGRYFAARARLGTALAELAQRVHDNPVQVQAVNALASDVARWDHTARAEIDRRAARGAPGHRAALTDQGLKLIGAIREQVQAIAQVEDRLLVRRTAAQARERTRSNAVAIGSVVLLGVLFALFGGRRVRMLIDEFERAMKSFDEVNVILERQVQERTRELERSLEDLRRSEAKLRTRANLIEATHDAVIVCSLDNRILLWNHAAETRYGWSATEALGQDITALLRTVFPAPLSEIDAELERTGYWEGNLVHTRKDGSTITVASRWVLQHDESGKPVSVLETNTDLSQIERIQRERVRALEETDRMKDEFLAVISHELRTPLNFIQGFASIIDDEVVGPVNAKQHEYLGSIAMGVDRMLELVNNLLDASRMAAGKFNISPSLTRYESVVRECLDSFRSQADQKHVALEMDLDVPQEVKIDGQRIIQVLTNLVSNALKFTSPGGRIRVAARMRDHDLLTEVTDTGIGIAPNDQTKLFKPFSQVDMSATRRFGGSGLGLTICKAIVEAHGGIIGLRSAPGEGSTFWFTLPQGVAPPQPVTSLIHRGAEPVAARAPAAPGVPADRNSKPLEVLVVEDDPHNLEVARVVLEEQGHHPTLVANGAEAVKLCEEGRVFDVVLMDVIMPVMDGLEATRRLRRCPSARDAVILIVSAKSSLVDSDKGLEAGADAFLSKPYTRQALIEAIAQARARRRSAPPGAAP